MTPSEIINSVKEVKPSVLDTSALLLFLNRVEAKLRKIINKEAVFEPLKFENIETDTLLLDRENSEIYEYYLCSQIDFYTNDIPSYNNSTMLYNQALSAYENELTYGKKGAVTHKYNYKGAFDK